jgi:hypothetical protein
MAGLEELGEIRIETPDRRATKVMDKNVDWDSVEKRGANK